jgi:GMP synthase-like glutamine amidotransferase
MVLVVQPDASDPVGRVGEWLRASGARLDIRAIDQGASLPDDLDGYAAFVVLGGAAGATEEAHETSLAPVRALLRVAVQREVPTLAICLGAQLLAIANGGRVGPNPEGPEFGAGLIAKRAAAATDPLFGDLPITPDVVQWHFDAVTQLPPGAQVLFASPVCEVQAFRLGRLAWGIQFHIETSPEVVRAWAAEDAAYLDGYDVAALLARVDDTDADVAEAWRPVVESFAAIVHDPSRVAAGRTVAVSTAQPLTDPAAIRAALAAELSAARVPHADVAPHGAAVQLPMPAPRLTGPDAPAGDDVPGTPQTGEHGG